MNQESAKSASNLHLTLPENTHGRDFVVSDIHGYRSLLDEQLEVLGFNPSADRVISVGDIIDRGPESEACLELLNEPWFWCIKGNHEQMFIDVMEGFEVNQWSQWLVNGGSWIVDIPEHSLKKWTENLSNLPVTLTIPSQGQTVGFCHAEFPASSWEERHQMESSAYADILWGRSRLRRGITRAIQDIDWVFSGHTIVPEVTILGNSVFIERGAYIGNPLTIIDLADWLNSQP